MELNKKTLREIAQIIKEDWNPVYFSAKPYLDAMESLDSINGSIGQDSSKEIILYFITNSKQWKGPVAREVKDYLKKLIKEAEMESGHVAEDAIDINPGGYEAYKKKEK